MLELFIEFDLVNVFAQKSFKYLILVVYFDVFMEFSCSIINLVNDECVHMCF